MKFFQRIILFSFLFLVAACKHDGIDGTNVTNNLLGNGDYIFTIHFDAEVMTIQKPKIAADSSRMTLLDKVALMPHTSRSEVNCGIKNRAGRR